MRLQFLKALGTSGAVHGAVLAAAIGLWALPQLAAQGRPERDLQVEYAQVEREAAPTPAPAEPLRPLAEPDLPQESPETLELPAPLEPLPRRTYVRPELSSSPTERMLRPFEPPPRPEPTPVVEQPPVDAPPVDEPDPEPPTQEVRGEPDLVEVDPLPVDCPAPRYPVQAERMGHEGVVRFQLLVAVDGTVREARITVSSGYGVLDRAAQRALLKWRFTPATRAGEPVEAELDWEIEFDR